MSLFESVAFKKKKNTEAVFFCVCDYFRRALKHGTLLWDFYLFYFDVPRGTFSPSFGTVSVKTVETSFSFVVNPISIPPSRIVSTA